jgi:hypothetical protein
MAIKAMLSGLFGIPLAWLASQCCSHASVGLLGDPLLEMFGIRFRGSPPWHRRGDAFRQRPL